MTCVTSVFPSQTINAVDLQHAICHLWGLGAELEPFCAFFTLDLSMQLTVERHGEDINVLNIVNSIARLSMGILTSKLFVCLRQKSSNHAQS